LVEFNKKHHAAARELAPSSKAYSAIRATHCNPTAQGLAIFIGTCSGVWQPRLGSIGPPDLSCMAITMC